MKHGLWKVAEVLDERVKAGDRLFITLMTQDGQVMTFASDNWRYLSQAVEELIRDGDRDDAYVLVVRRFDGQPSSGNIPAKTVAGFVVRMEWIVPLSAQEIRDASQTDNLTGRRIPPEPAVSFTDGLELLPELAPLALEAELPAGGNGPSLH